MMSFDEAQESLQQEQDPMFSPDSTSLLEQKKQSVQDTKRNKVQRLDPAKANTMDAMELQEHVGRTFAEEQVYDREDGSMYQIKIDKYGDTYEVPFEGKTRVAYIDNTEDGNMKFGLAAEGQGFEGRYNGEKDNIYDNYGWAPGEKGVTNKNGALAEVRLPYNVATKLEFDVHSNRGMVKSRIGGNTAEDYAVMKRNDMLGQGATEYTFDSAPLWNADYKDDGKALGEDVMMPVMPKYNKEVKQENDVNTVTGYLSNLVDGAQSTLGVGASEIADMAIDAGLRGYKNYRKLSSDGKTAGLTEEEASKEVYDAANRLFGRGIVDENGNFSGLDRFKEASDYGYNSERVDKDSAALGKAWDSGDPLEMASAIATSIDSIPELIITSGFDIILASVPGGQMVFAAKSMNKVLEDRIEAKGTTDLSEEDYLIAGLAGTVMAKLNNLTGGNAGLKPHDASLITNIFEKVPDVKTAVDKAIQSSFGRATMAFGEEATEEGLQTGAEGVGQKLGTKNEGEITDGTLGKEMFVSSALGGLSGFGMNVGKQAIDRYSGVREKNAIEKAVEEPTKVPMKQERIGQLVDLVKSPENMSNAEGLAVIREIEDGYDTVESDQDREILFEIRQKMQKRVSENARDQVLAGKSVDSKTEEGRVYAQSILASDDEALLNEVREKVDDDTKEQIDNKVKVLRATKSTEAVEYEVTDGSMGYNTYAKQAVNAYNNYLATGDSKELDKAENNLADIARFQGLQAAKADAFKNGITKMEDQILGGSRTGLDRKKAASKWLYEKKEAYKAITGKEKVDGGFYDWLNDNEIITFNYGPKLESEFTIKGSDVAHAMLGQNVSNKSGIAVYNKIDESVGNMEKVKDTLLTVMGYKPDTEQVAPEVQTGIVEEQVTEAPAQVEDVQPEIAEEQTTPVQEQVIEETKVEKPTINVDDYQDEINDIDEVTEEDIDPLWEGNWETAEQDTATASVQLDEDTAYTNEVDEEDTDYSIEEQMEQLKTMKKETTPNSKGDRVVERKEDESVEEFLDRAANTFKAKFKDTNDVLIDKHVTKVTDEIDAIDSQIQELREKQSELHSITKGNYERLTGIRAEIKAEKEKIDKLNTKMEDYGVDSYTGSQTKEELMGEVLNNDKVYSKFKTAIRHSFANILKLADVYVKFATRLYEKRAKSNAEVETLKDELKAVKQSMKQITVAKKLTKRKIETLKQKKAYKQQSVKNWEGRKSSASKQAIEKGMYSAKTERRWNINEEGILNRYKEYAEDSIVREEKKLGRKLADEEKTAIRDKVSKFPAMVEKADWKSTGILEVGRNSLSKNDIEFLTGMTKEGKPSTKPSIGVKMTKGQADSFLKDRDLKNVLTTSYKGASKLASTRLDVNPISKGVARMARNTMKTISEVLAKPKSKAKTSEGREVRMEFKHMATSPARGIVFEEDGKVNPNTAAAIGVVGNEYVRFQGNGSITVKEVARLIGKESEDVTPAMMKMFQNGIPRKYVARKLGQQALSLLGMKAKKDGVSTIYDQLVTDLGNVILATIEAEGKIETTLVDTAEYNKALGNTVGKQDKSQTALIKVTHAVTKQEAYNADKMMEDIEANEIFRNVEFTKPKKSKDRLRNGVKTKRAAKKLEEKAEELENDEYRLDQKVMAKLKEFGEDVIKVRMGYKDAEGLSATAKMSATAKNAQIDKSYNELMVLSDKVDEREKEGKSLGMYFKYFLSKNGRFFIDSVGINPQTDKLHRFVMGSKKQIQTVKEDSKVFRLAIAQAFGIGIDKLSMKSALEKADKILAMDRKELERVVLEGEIKVDGLKLEAEHVSHTVAALVALEAYDNRVDGEFETSLALEFDAVTSGFILKLMQMPLLNKDMVIDWLAKGGVFIGGMNKELGAMLEDGSITDAYKTNAKKVERVEGTTKEIAKVDTLGLFEYMNTEVGDIVDKDGMVTSMGRNLLKSPFMVFNYGAALKSIVNAVGRSLVDASPANKVDLGTKLLKAEKGTPMYTMKQKIVQKLNRKVHTDVTTVAKLDELLKEKMLHEIQLNNGKDLYTYTTEVMAEAYGKQVEAVFEEEFGAIIAANKKINNLYKVMFRMYDVVYKDKLAKMDNPTTEDKIKIMEELKDVFPMIKSPISEDTDDGVALIKTAMLNDPDNAAVTALADGKKMTTQQMVRDFEEAVSSAIVLPIHYIDGSLMANTLEQGVLGIHDAVMVGINDAEATVKNYNKNVYDTSKEYSMLEAMDDNIEQMKKAVVEIGGKSLMNEVISTVDAENKGMQDDNRKKLKKWVPGEQYTKGKYEAMTVAEIVEGFRGLVNEVKEARKELFEGNTITVDHMIGTDKTSYTHEVKGQPKPTTKKREDSVKGINISSYSNGLSYALTNPTNDVSKGQYIIEPSTALPNKPNGVANVEGWYKANNAKVNGIPEGQEGDLFDVELMAGLIADKFTQYPELVNEIDALGGKKFLEVSTHNIHTKNTHKASRWENVGNGRGLFIKALVAGYKNATSNSTKQEDSTMSEVEQIQDARKQVEEAKRGCK